MEAIRNQPDTPHSPKRRKALLPILLGVGLLSTVAALLLTLPPDKSLEKVAIPVLSMKNLDKPVPSFPSNFHYVRWATDNEVLVGKNLNASSWRICRMTLRPKPQSEPIPINPSVIIPVGTMPISISPNGKWMATVTYVMKNNSTSKILTGVLSLSGEKSIDSEDTMIYDGVWSPDSSKIYETYPRNGNSLHVTEVNNRRVKEISLIKSSFIPSQFHLLGVKNNQDGSADLILSKTNPLSVGAPVSSWRAPLNSKAADFEMISMNQNYISAIPKKWFLKAPEDGSWGTLHLSPKGDRLLWNLEQHRYTGLLSLLHHLFPKMTFPNTPSKVWKVSKLDGSEMHEIAHYAIPTNTTNVIRVEINPVWMPGGKSVSYQKDEMLYTVPAD